MVDPKLGTQGAQGWRIHTFREVKRDRGQKKSASKKNIILDPKKPIPDQT
jgi:hypothetical protein